jgi:hypothetical protein
MPELLTNLQDYQVRLKTVALVYKKGAWYKIDLFLKVKSENYNFILESGSFLSLCCLNKQIQFLFIGCG